MNSLLAAAQGPSRWKKCEHEKYPPFVFRENVDGNVQWMRILHTKNETPFGW